MCLATAWITVEDHKEEMMRDVAWIGIEAEGIVMVSFLGERMVTQARIKSVDLLQGTIILENNKET
jgi:predicted RNA-binding protein